MSNIKFVDLNTGNVFNGEYPYVFRFDGEQSINILYSKPICFISKDSDAVVSIDQNDIFKIIDPSRFQNVEKLYGVDYYNIKDSIVKENSIRLNGTLHHNYYIYIFYIVSSASQAGEYTENFYINDEQYKILGDFYGEEESYYINLSNNGVSIPESIQKAIYGTNVHEDKRDNILLNRKWKELLSNYWDVIANKGSYKSLINSLKWFEYGDLVKLKEVWKRNDEGINRYEFIDIQKIVSDKYFESFDDFSKTTYMSLSYSLQEILKDDNGIVWNDEGNPELKNIIHKWSIQDLSLKLYLLGNFYESYFMPIHLDLMHSTIESVVYSNTFKVLTSGSIGRNDYICDTQSIKCNIKNGDIYQLSNEKCYVGKDVLFASDISEDIIGVQRSVPDGPMTDKQKGNYVFHLYNSIGAIIDFNIELPLMDGDFIEREMLIFKYNDECIEKVDYKVIKDNKFSFSILCKYDGDYEARLQFDTASGKTFVKSVKFQVIDTSYGYLKIYKIKNNGSTYNLFKGKESGYINDYVFKKQEYTGEGLYKFKQYIPALTSSNDGVKLNHLLTVEWNDNLASYLSDKYYTAKLTKNDKSYIVCVCKTFNEVPEYDVYLKADGRYFDYNGGIYRILKEKMIYVPEFHHLEEFDGGKESLYNYIIHDYDALCVIPSIPHSRKIEGIEWEFVNETTGKSISLEGSVNEPLIAQKDKKVLDDGYYSIIFKYRLAQDTDKVNIISLDSAFIKR